jgi:hypothetical protein
VNDDDTQPITGLAALVARGELSATAYLAVVEIRARRWDRAILDRLDRGLTLHYPEVAWLLFATIGVLLLAALGVAL